MPKRKTRKVRAAARTRVKAKGKKNSKSPNTTTRVAQSLASKNRAEGLRLFKLAGRPTREQFIVVYGDNGPEMTWEQRAKAGVPASKFQAALAVKRA